MVATLAQMASAAYYLESQRSFRHPNEYYTAGEEPDGVWWNVATLMPFYGPIGKAGGTRFWFHALRNCFIAVAERELMLPRSLTKRLVNHARSSDITEGYAAEWTVGQLREPAQRIADRIEALTNANGTDTA